MKAEITISRIHANEDDEYIAIKVKCDDGSRAAYELSLEDFALVLTGQQVTAEVTRVSPPRIRNRV